MIKWRFLKSAEKYSVLADFAFILIKKLAEYGINI